MKFRHMDHAGIIFKDVTVAKTFFVDCGFNVGEPYEMEGHWIGEIIGLKDVKTRVVWASLPDGQTSLELIQFLSPLSDEGLQAYPANTPGLRHLAFIVEDIDAIAARLKQRGTEIVGTVHNYQDIYKLCYIRGPEGIILELSEELKK